MSVRLKLALTVVAMKDLDLGAMMSGAQDAESMMADARRALDGKDREEIVAWAKETRLNPLSGLAAHRDNPLVAQTWEVAKQYGAAAAANLVKLLR
mgnify:CR=1 FL=1